MRGVYRSSRNRVEEKASRQGVPSHFQPNTSNVPPSFDFDPGIRAGFGFSGKSSSVSGWQQRRAVISDVVHAAVNARSFNLIRVKGPQKIDRRKCLIGWL
jgi:hypothetical protein